MLRLLLAGSALFLALTTLALADVVVGGLVHNFNKGKTTVAAEGMSVTQNERAFSFSESLYSMNYTFTINGNNLVNSDGTVAGTFGPDGFEFTYHYIASQDIASQANASSCDDHYKVDELFGIAIYYNSYTCTDGTKIIDTGNLYPYSYLDQERGMR